MNSDSLTFLDPDAFMLPNETPFHPRLFGVPRESGANLSYRTAPGPWRTIWCLKTSDHPFQFTFVPDLQAHVIFDLHGTIETVPFVVRPALSPVRLQCEPGSFLMGVGFLLWDCSDWFLMNDNEPDGRGWLSKEQSWADLVYFFLLSRLQTAPIETHHAANYLAWFENEMERLDSEHTGLFRRLGEPLEMALAASYSPRQLRRLQRQHAGVGPKDLHRITRFQRQLARLQDEGVLDALGYSDQAHAIREFRKFTGLTPGQYMKQTQIGRNVQSILDA